MRLKKPPRAVALATAAVLVILAILLEVRSPRGIGKLALMTGTVVEQSANPHLQRPIGNATITVQSGATTGTAVSESSGLFRLRLNPAISSVELLQIRVEHPGYLAFTVTTPATDQIYVIRLTPAARQDKAATMPPQIRLSNIRVRYATQTTSTTTVGPAVRAFDVVNKGNVPCQQQAPCSPDGKWKATVGSMSLDTGEANKQFRNVRVSCIAGPCPFSAIESDRFSDGGRSISVSVRNWSDPVTYLLEAEVVQTMQSELIRHNYPATFGRSMNFTLPSVASGLSIEADVDGSPVVFPLGPLLHLSWATCRFDIASDGTKQYRCELKPGYRFD